MKELLISNCEKNYVLKALEDSTRLDGRAFDEFRELKIDFGKDWGCCHVALGETRVLAQVSCEIQQPKSARPNEGLININVELSPMAAPQFEAGRQSELSVHLNRLLEKCIKDSRAVDLESLCIKLAEKVWALRIDINVLNNEGNILDCASVAALTALLHFRRPDVTSDGEMIKIHTYKERDPIPTVVHHYPICVTFAIFNQCSTCVADPSLLEEGVSEAQLVLAINSFKEICSIHLGGSAFVNHNLILQCAAKTAKRAFNLVQQIKQDVEQDLEKRKQNKKIFFEHYLIKNNDEESTSEQLTAILNKWSIKTSKKKQKQVNNDSEEQPVAQEPTNTDTVEKAVIFLGEGSAALLSKQDEEQMESSSDSDIEIVEPTPKKQIFVESDGDVHSEEETVVTLHSEFSKKKTTSKGKKKK